MRALPLMSIAHEPQISSRQFESYVIGVVLLPSRVTGFSAMSRRQIMMFIDGRHGSANSSQRTGSFGPCRRLIRRMTCFSAMVAVSFRLNLFRGVVTARSRRNHGNVDRFVGQLD